MSLSAFIRREIWFGSSTTKGWGVPEGPLVPYRPRRVEFSGSGVWRGRLAPAPLRRNVGRECRWRGGGADAEAFPLQLRKVRGHTWLCSCAGWTGRRIPQSSGRRPPRARPWPLAIMGAGNAEHSRRVKRTGPARFSTCSSSPGLYGRRLALSDTGEDGGFPGRAPENTLLRMLTWRRRMEDPSGAPLWFQDSGGRWEVRC